MHSLGTGPGWRFLGGPEIQQEKRKHASEIRWASEAALYRYCFFDRTLTQARKVGYTSASRSLQSQPKQKHVRTNESDCWSTSLCMVSYSWQQISRVPGKRLSLHLLLNNLTYPALTPEPQCLSNEKHGRTVWWDSTPPCHISTCHPHLPPQPASPEIAIATVEWPGAERQGLSSHQWDIFSWFSCLQPFLVIKA